MDINSLRKGEVYVGDTFCIEWAMLHPKLKELLLKKNPLYQFDEQYNQYTSGDGLIQHIFPNLSAATREILITGICPTCWDNAFK